MILYHVTKDLFHSGVFEPRIPHYRHQIQEDDKTLRISTAPSVEDCLSGIPNGGFRLRDLVDENRGYFKVFRIDTEKLKIADEDIIKDKALYEDDRIRDAELTKEHWILKGFQVPQEDQFTIQLLNYQDNPYYVVPHSIYKVANEEYDGDFVTAYETIYQECVPESGKIVEILYQSSKVEKGEQFTLTYEETEEREAILQWVSSHSEVSFNGLQQGQICLIATKTSDISSLFRAHYDVIWNNVE